MRSSLAHHLREKRRECSALKQSNLYRRCSRLKVKLNQLTQQLAALSTVQEELQEEKSKKRRAQVSCSQLQAKRRKLEKDVQRLEEVNNSFRALEHEATSVIPPPTRDETGKFTESVIRCVMELVGENEVPARHCSEVVRTVARTMFGVNFEDHSLPSKTSALRFTEQIHPVANLHIAEELSQQHFDLHIDGTSKNTKKYVGMQVTLEDKTTLSLGFDPVAHETAQTLLDLALSKLLELAQLHSPEDAEQQLRNMLSNLVGVMSDRAATMKAFSKRLQDHIQLELDPNVQIDFLNCNAHFLLGLSSAAEKAITEIAKAAGLHHKLGREILPAFQRFKSPESAACRYIYVFLFNNHCPLLLVFGEGQEGWGGGGEEEGWQ